MNYAIREAEGGAVMERIETAVEKWLIHARQFTLKTQEHYKMVISQFIKSLPPETETIDQLSSSLIEQYIDGLLVRWTNRTGNAHLTACKSFARWLARNYDIPNHAAKVSMLREAPPNARFLTWDEYQQILKSEKCPEQYKDVIRFIANTGLRKTEMLNLKWSNINQGFKMLTITGKGRRRRHIPLNQISRDILLKCPRESDYCFAGLISNSQSRNCLYQLCKNITKRTGIKRFGPHSIRHLFATTLLERGVPIAHVSMLLGHASIETTQRAYIHFTPAFLAGLTDCLMEKELNPAAEPEQP